MKSDEKNRWCTEWHRYTRCPQTNEIMYGDRILIWPSTTPCSKKCIQWSTLLSINGSDPVTLVGPFHFEPINESNRVGNKVYYDQWRSLTTAYKLHGILPPTIGPNSTHKIPTNKVNPSRKSKRAKSS